MRSGSSFSVLDFFLVGSSVSLRAAARYAHGGMRDRVAHHPYRNCTVFHRLFADFLHNHHVVYTVGTRFITHKHVAQLKQ